MTFKLGSGAEPLFVVNAHLSLGKKAQEKQLGFICDLIQGKKHVIVMGDFNAEPEYLFEQSPIKDSTLVMANPNCYTYPSWQPKKQIDYILVSPNIKIKEAGAIVTQCSDHLPVYAELILPSTIHLSAI
jgi:endonuclease/exonuclease/phosphatase family metal-dependent hydrolase